MNSNNNGNGGYNSGYQGSNRNYQRSNNGNKERERKNSLKEKELLLKTTKVTAFQKAFEEQIKSLDRHELVLKQIIPEGYVQKVANGRTTTLPKAETIIIALNSYFSKIGLTITDKKHKDVIKFLGDYQVWRDEKMAGYKKDLEENILLNATTIEVE